MDNLTKKCTKCGGVKSLIEFYVNKKGIHQRSEKCIPCLKDYQKLFYDKANLRRRQRYATDEVFKSEKLRKDKLYTSTGRRNELYQQNKDRKLEIAREQRKKHRSKNLAKMAKWREANRDSIKKSTLNTVLNLADSYVAFKIRRSLSLPLPLANIPKTAITNTRILMQLNRELKNIKSCQNQPTK